MIQRNFLIQWLYARILNDPFTRKDVLLGEYALQILFECHKTGQAFLLSLIYLVNGCVISVGFDRNHASGMSAIR
jgi:hypothetical protein